jgi:hypothetical protein
MALTITAELISSDQIAHTAGPSPGHPHAWEASWLPSWHMTQDTAITAMMLADAVTLGGLHPGHRLWPHLQGWAADPGLTAPGVLARAPQPPGDLSGNDAAHVPPGPEAARP